MFIVYYQCPIDRTYSAVRASPTVLEYFGRDPAQILDEPSESVWLVPGTQED